MRGKLQVGRAAQGGLFESATATTRVDAAASAPESCPDLSPEAQYALHADPSHRRRLAQFFTPPEIARLMVEMAQAMPGQTLLEPACGTGALVAALRDAHQHLRITAIDIDPVPIAHLRASQHRASDSEVLVEDFLAWNDARSFDRVVANPPYLKYQHFDCSESVYERLSSALGVTISRFSNLYLLFLLEGYRRLRPGGRLVYLVPGEWTNANFGTPFKQFLARERCLTRLIYFSHAVEAFDDALTTSSIIELVKPGAPEEGCDRFLALYAGAGTSPAQITLALAAGTSRGAVIASMRDIKAMADETKWDHLLREAQPSATPAAHWSPLRKWCSSRRGIATGANDFFHLAPSRAAALGIPAQHLLPCVGGARHVKGVIFAARDYDALHTADQPCLLLNTTEATTSGEIDYIRHGEALGLPKRYLLSVRKPWFRMEKANPAPVWIGVFGRGGLRVVRNRSGAAQLTTFHGLRPASNDPLLADALVVLLNAPAAREAISRTRRVFGAGLEKIEPADLLDIQLPDLSALPRGLVESLARFLEPIDSALRLKGDLDAELQGDLDAAVHAVMTSIDVQACVERGAIEVQHTASRHDEGIDTAQLRLPHLR